MIIKKMLFATLLGLSLTGAKAQVKFLKTSDEAKELSQKVTELFKENKISIAIKELRPYWPLPSNEMDNLEEMTIKQLNMAEERFGRVMIADIRYSDSNQILVIIVVSPSVVMVRSSWSSVHVFACFPDESPAALDNYLPKEIHQGLVAMKFIRTKAGKGLGNRFITTSPSACLRMKTHYVWEETRLARIPST